MKILELYAGSRSIGKVGDQRGHQVFSIDNQPFKNIDLVADMEFVTLKDIPFVPDMVWASPPCTTYSIAAISYHRDQGTPKTILANRSDKLVLNTLNLIKEFNCIYYIENPRGYLRKMSFMQGLPRTTVWYCQYGDEAAKPTDIWSNNIYSMFNLNGWQPRTQCRNNEKRCHHEPTPRGAKTGTQGKTNAYERSKIPYELCRDIIQATERSVRGK